MDYSLVSVIVPFYNSESFLLETLNSVRSQTYKNWELILIDDCSIDKSLEIAKRFSREDDRVKIVQLSRNSGKAVAINEGCKVSKGRYIAFLDSDDLWMPEKLSRQIEFMEKGDYAVSCTSYVQFNSNSRELGRVFKAKSRVGYRRVLLDCPVGQSTVIYDVLKLGIQIVPNIRKRQDDALWLQILKKEPYIWGLQDILMQYRISEKSLSRNKLSLVKYHWVLYRKIEHIDIFRSVAHIMYWGIIKILGIK